jgi:hypothetical protein
MFLRIQEEILKPKVVLVLVSNKMNATHQQTPPPIFSAIVVSKQARLASIGVLLYHVKESIEIYEIRNVVYVENTHVKRHLVGLV